MEARVGPSARGTDVDCGTHVAAARDGLREIVCLVGGILGVVDVLLPDKDGVGRSRRCGPLRVKRRGFRKLIAEGELIAVGARLVGIPTAEGVTIALGSGGGDGLLALFEELGRRVARALAVLLEDQPMAVGSVDQKRDGAFDLDVGLIGIRGVRVDGGTVGQRCVGCRGNVPTLEVLIGGLGCVRHVDLVRDLIVVADDEQRIGAEDDALAGLVGHVIDRVDLGVVRDLVALLDAGVQQGRHGIADVIDVHAVIGGCDGVVLIVRPATEDLVIGNGADTRIVKNGVELLAEVGLLDHHGGDFLGAVHELDGQARVVAGLALVDDDVNREAVSREVLGRLGGHGIDLGGVAGLVVDVVDRHVLAGDVRVVEANDHGDKGLNLVAVGVVDGHVDRDHAVDFLALGSSSSLDRVGNLVGVNLRGLDVGTLGKRAFVGKDGHEHVVDKRLQRLRGIGDLGSCGLVNRLGSGLGHGLCRRLVNGFGRGLCCRLCRGLVNRLGSGLVNRLGSGLVNRLGSGLLNRLGCGLVNLRLRLIGSRLGDDDRLILEVCHLLDGSGLFQTLLDSFCNGLRRE